MKISMAVSTPDAEFSALALKGSYDEIFALLKDSGYDGVELAVKNPADVDIPELEKLLARYGLILPAIGTGRAFGEEGLCFSSRDSAVRAAAVERIKSHVDMCSRIGALVIIGLIVGKEPRSAETEKLAAECMKQCAEYGLEKGVEFVVEPINRYETGFIVNVDICLEFLDKVGFENCKVLFDTFHANIEEASIEDSIRKAGKRIGHVHVADSNRYHPGAGHTDFFSIIKTLREHEYNGFLSAEIFPLPDPETATRNNARFMKQVISR